MHSADYLLSPSILVHLRKRLIYDVIAMLYDTRNVDITSIPSGVKN